jgi:predicted phosphodiesterase
MIRKSKKKVDAILTADWHLREDTPICWAGDFQKVQWESVDFVSELQKLYNCPVLHAGDLYNYWKPSPWLLSKTMKHLPYHFYSVYGNHDLPQHNLDLAEKCGVYTLEKAGKLLTQPTGFNDWEMCHWKGIPSNQKPILVWHTFTYQGKEPWPGCTSPKGSKLLKQYPNYNLILTGDNHIPFVEEYEGRILVNPGPLMIQKANEVDLPRVYLWHFEDNTVTPVYLPFEDAWITEGHLEKEKERESRITSFVTRLNSDWKATMSFEDNLQIFENTNTVQPSIMQIVYKSLEQ